MSEPHHDRVLEAFEQCYARNEYPWVETQDIVEALAEYDVSSRTIRNRLNDLVERGDIQKRKPGREAAAYYKERDDVSVSASE